MKKERRFLIIVTLLILVLIIITAILLRTRQNVMKNLPDEYEFIEPELNMELERVSSRNNFYIVKNCISKFYIYCTYLYDEEEEVEEDTINALLNMLDEEYISYNSITNDNLTAFLPDMNKIKVNIEDMYVSQKNDNVYVYYVYGDLINSSKFQVEEFSMIVKIDMQNRTFKVLLNDYVISKYPNMQEGEYIEITCPEAIESNDYNMFNYDSISDQTYIGDIFNNLINNMLFNRNATYEDLDEEYKSKRFPTFEDFEQYIKDNVRNITIAKLSQYQKNINDDGSIQYICIDSNGNYYVINEISTMNCSFILDTYTIDLPEFLAKYEDADSATKVALNLEKIKEAINFKDFEYVYNKTDNTFKNSKFKNYEEFENYLKSNLFEQNTFEYKNIEEKANVYVAKVIVTNKKDVKAESKEIQVIMKLTDSTDYSISFNFGE